MFTPKINEKSKKIKRETRIEETLLHDAKRRQERMTQRTEVKQETKVVSKSSIKLIFQRFTQDFQ